MQGTKRIMVTVLLNSKRGESCREGQVNYVNSHYDAMTTEIMQTFNSCILKTVRDFFLSVTKYLLSGYRRHHALCQESQKRKRMRAEPYQSGQSATEGKLPK